ncbi:hypothetical protein FGU65_03110 [Methanoculleus sp. FWC-SCC1]|uniref:DUF2062 domain-containing protein n=1 Tax=Methanoculleus frigidifontis TaxID=2584085 RepID=A0ABT8M7J3_9EURY|nr:hypothetical protein [Methanoculleus sp. FWC-SCC1]MDN7023890.1 hypothetical protein [Methanoculleus sp. FWC-SCC1]
MDLKSLVKSPKRKVRGGILATIGYILSPLSWWNDLFVNIPLAYVFAIPFGMVSEDLFLPAMIVGYWITNIAGFILLHKGVVDIATSEEKEYTRKDFLKDLLISILYTAVIGALIAVGVVRFPTEYFQQ